MQRMETRAVRFEAIHAVQLEPDVVLLPGFYIGIETRIGVEKFGEVTWGKPEYKIELTADQLASMGAQVAPNLISGKINVTKFVRSGELDVT
jgi:hypothetical protein